MTFGVYTNMDSTFSKAMWEALVEHFTAIHGEDAAERMATLKADIQAEETAMLVDLIQGNAGSATLWPNEHHTPDFYLN